MVYFIAKAISHFQQRSVSHTLSLFHSLRCFALSAHFCFDIKTLLCIINLSLNKRISPRAVFKGCKYTKAALFGFSIVLNCSILVLCQR
jgi:hypothetical protein